MGLQCIWRKRSEKIKTVIHIAKNTCISEDELVFKASRSSGPGGQNINKLNTRITLFFNVSSSPSLSEWQKQRVLSHLATRADKNGVLRVVSQKFRTQKANRKAATERLQQLLQEALKTRPVRKKTKVPPYARERRLQEKKHRSLLKQRRTRRNWTEWNRALAYCGSKNLSMFSSANQGKNHHGGNDNDY